MQSQTVNISLPAPLLRQVDLIAKEEYSTRSDLIRQALLEKVRQNEEWRRIFAYGKKVGRKAGIKSEEDAYKIVEEYRREKHGRAHSS